MRVGDIYERESSEFLIWTGKELLPCDGRRLSREEYPALAHCLGGLYMSDNGDTFRVPALK